jgi:hypothetical protein
MTLLESSPASLLVERQFSLRRATNSFAPAANGMVGGLYLQREIFGEASLTGFYFSTPPVDG